MNEISDGDRLKALLGKRNRAQFARANGIEGGGSMISQHTSGHRPISLEAATAYANGLGVPIDAISPSLAAKVAAAAATLQPATAAVAKEPTPVYAAAPVSIDAAIARIDAALGTAPEHTRPALALNMDGWARGGGGEPWRGLVASLLSAPNGKQHRKVA